MKSPDRDAADELAIEQVHALALWFDDQADTRRFMFVMKIADELATLRRRVAEMEETLRYYANGPFAGRARIALSPPTRKE